MPISTITYSDKSDINVNSSVPSTNKVQATDMNEIKSVVNNNASILNGVKGTTIWENPNPTSNFGAMSLSFGTTDYDYIEIYYYDFSSTQRMESQKSIRGEKTAMMTMLRYQGLAYMGYRQAYYTDDDTFFIDEAYSLIEGNAFTSQVRNDWLIPQRIVIYKTN